MIGIRTSKGDIWIQEAEWTQWVRSGRISPETWVHAGAASGERWRRASDLEIFWAELDSKRDLSGEAPVYPSDLIGKDGEPDSGVAPSGGARPPERGPALQLLSSPPALPEFMRHIFPRSGMSATESLVLLNLIVAAVLIYFWKTDYVNEIGRLSQRWRIGVDEGRYYYLIFAAFVHVGARHLIYNMASLLAASAAVEYTYGRWSTVVAYLMTGLGCSIFSLVQKDSPFLSVGASGAIFGLAGLMVVFLIRFYRALSARQKWKTRRIYIPLMVLFILPSLFSGDAWGHLGGLGAGLILGWFLRPAGYIRRHMAWVALERERHPDA